MFKKLAAGIFLFSVVVPAQIISLQDAVDMAMENNAKIKQYSEKLEQKEYENLAAWGNFLPKIGIEASYTHLDEELQMDLNPIREAMIQLQTSNSVNFANISNILQTGTPLTDAQKQATAAAATQQLEALLPSFTETLKKQDYKSASFVGVLPLFMGGKLIAAKKFSSAQENAASDELEKTRQEITAQTVNAYLTAILLKEVIFTRREVLAGIKNHKNNADKLFKEGVIPKYHLLRAEVAFAEAKQSLDDDVSNFEISILGLKQVLGITDTAQIFLSDSLAFHRFPDQLDDVLASADENQPVLKLIRENKIAAAQKYNVERSKFLPQIAAFGKYEMYPQYLSALEPRWAVGVQMSINLFNGFSDYHNLKSASHLEKEIEFIEFDTKSRINLWVNKSFKDANNQIDKYNNLNPTVNLAKENLRLNEERFNNGVGTSLEVIDARLSLQKAELDKLVALANYYKNLTSLYLAEGRPEKVLNVWMTEK